jgi:hypothetical protein
MPEDFSSMFLRNVRIYRQDCTVLTACSISDLVLLVQACVFHVLFSFAFEHVKLPWGIQNGFISWFNTHILQDRQLKLSVEWLYLLVRLLPLASCQSDICRVCGLVVRVPVYRSRGPGFDSRRYQIFWERGPHSLVRITEELLEWKSSGSGV